MLIQVIGSKPNVTFLDNVDLHFFVNGSVYLMDLHKTINSSAMTGQRVFDRSTEAACRVSDSFRFKKLDQLHLICFQNENINNGLIDKLPVVYNKLVQITRTAKGNLELQFIQSFNAFILNILKTPKVNLMNKISLIIYVFKNKELKLSSGLFSVIYLLTIYPECKVVISGIGFGKSEYWWGKENKLRHHFLNDFAFLKSISNKHEFWNRVMTTEPELTDLFGIKPYFKN